MVTGAAASEGAASKFRQTEVRLDPVCPSCPQARPDEEDETHQDAQDSERVADQHGEHDPDDDEQ